MRYEDQSHNPQREWALKKYQERLNSLSSEERQARRKKMLDELLKIKVQPKDPKIILEEIAIALKTNNSPFE